MKSRVIVVSIFGLAVLLNGAPARADDVYTFIVKKQEDKQKSHWSLADWLDTQNKMKVMDMWLAMHSPSPYEFFLAGDYRFGQTSSGGGTGTGYTAWSASAAAFASIFGLEAQYESTLDTRWLALFDLRIFGYHDQSTNITLFGGLRGVSAPSATFRDPVVGARIDLYLGRFFGLNGLYRVNLASSGAPQSVTGYRLEGGAFIDFRLIRVIGKYFTEPETSDFGAGSVVQTTRSGFTLGAQLYF